MTHQEYNVSDIIIDQDGRRGVVTWAWSPDNQSYDKDIVFVRPADLSYKTKHDIPGMGSQITITATAWHIQPDGTLLGDWFDHPLWQIDDKIARKDTANV